LEYTHTGLSTDVDVQYKVRAQSGKGYGEFSIRNTFVLAGYPTVSSAPTRVTSARNSITVEWVISDDGGTPITGYRLYQIDVKTGAETLAYDGTDMPTVSSARVEGLDEGDWYQYSVAAINRVGEGSQSPYSIEFISSQLPARSAIPEFVSATSTSISLAFEATEDNGGSPVSLYTLYATEAAADGESTETYASVASYDGASMAFTLEQSGEPAFLSGTKYRFRLSATNTIGEGEMSNSVTIALADDALQPDAPTRDLSRST
jgi:hypothetical protein